MYSFSELIKRIREEGGLTQKEFANILSVSTVLVSMIETGQKKVSKNFIVKLASKLEVNPSSITPFLFVDKNLEIKSISNIEKDLIRLGERLQSFLIKRQSKKLKKYVFSESKIPQDRYKK